MPGIGQGQIVEQIEQIHRWRTEHNPPLDFGEIARRIGVGDRRSVRNAYHRWLGRVDKAVQPPVNRDDGVTFTGLMADYRDKTDAELWAAREADWHRALKKSQLEKDRSIVLPKGPVGIAWIADQHLDDASCDIPKLKRDAEIIRDTPGLWAIDFGDHLNNWIVGKLQGLQRGAPVRHDESIALLCAWAKTIKPKMLAVVGGNHDAWWQKMGGIDYLHQLFIDAKCFYDPDEVEFDLSAGGRVWRVIVRHKFNWRSILNISHGAERHNERVAFADILVSGHEHAATYCRPFPNVMGSKSYAIAVGSYKKRDRYGKEIGLRPSQDCGSGMSVFHNGAQMFFDDLEHGAEYLTWLRGKK